MTCRKRRDDIETAGESLTRDKASAALAITQGDEAAPERVREITEARNSGQDVKQILAKLNPVLRGWGNYFRCGTCSREFLMMDSFVYARLVRWLPRSFGLWVCIDCAGPYFTRRQPHP